VKVITEQHVQGNTTIVGLNTDQRETSVVVGSAETIWAACAWIQHTMQEAIDGLPPDEDRVYEFTIYNEDIRINAHHRSEQ